MNNFYFAKLKKTIKSGKIEIFKIRFPEVLRKRDRLPVVISEPFHEIQLFLGQFVLRFALELFRQPFRLLIIFLFELIYCRQFLPDVVFRDLPVCDVLKLSGLFIYFCLCNRTAVFFLQNCRHLEIIVIKTLQNPDSDRGDHQIITGSNLCRDCRLRVVFAFCAVGHNIVNLKQKELITQ